MLVTSKELLLKAQEGGYAVGAPAWRPASAGPV